MKRILIFILFILIATLFGCDKGSSSAVSFGKAFPKSVPQDLTYENTSVVLTDMKIYTDAVKSVDPEILEQVNGRYTGVYFHLLRAPLIVGITPDASHGLVVMAIATKDPDTGSNYLLKFDKKLPVVESDTVELQIRTRDEKGTVFCSLPVSDPVGYLTDYRGHELELEMTLYKRFLQSGTFDFDALTIPSYRIHGFPFIVFDLVKARITDNTAHLTAECRLQG